MASDKQADFEKIATAMFQAVTIGILEMERALKMCVVEIAATKELDASFVQKLMLLDSRRPR